VGVFYPQHRNNYAKTASYLHLYLQRFRNVAFHPQRVNAHQSRVVAVLRLEGGEGLSSEKMPL
jgi:hypothetical protein